MSLLDLATPHYREKITSAFDEAKIKKSDVNFELTVVRPNDHEIRWVHLSAQWHSEYCEKDNILSGVVQDITKRKIAELNFAESEAQLEELVKTSPLPMIIAEPPPTGNVLLYNTSFIEAFGYVIDDIPDLNAWWPTVYPDPDYRAQTLGRWNDAIGKMLVDGRNHLEDPFFARVRTKNESDRFVEINLSLHAHRCLVILNDITERINSENELRLAKELAETALNNLKCAYSDLKAAQEQLVQSEKLASLGRLVAGASHEINTPIGVALTVSTLLSDQLTSFNNLYRSNNLRYSTMNKYIADTEECLDLLIKNVRRSAELVHSLKQVSADQASEKIRSFDLMLCLQDTVRTFGPLWLKSGHELDLICPDAIEINSYPGVFSQIIANLISNSITHGFETGHHGRITINARATGIDAVELTYHDDGKGIPSDIQSNVYEPFFTTRRNIGSTGLGMYIVYNLVTSKLGGAIDLLSKDGEGVLFTIRFPRAPASSQGSS